MKKSSIRGNFTGRENARKRAAKKRRKNITAKRKPKVDKSLVQKLTIRKGVVRSMFET